MSDELESVEDLIALSRRGELSKADSRRLEAKLAVSPEDRLLREAARGFDLETSIEVDDAAQIERLVRRFQKRGKRPVLSRTRRVALGLVAATVLVGAMVGAMLLGSRAKNQAKALSISLPKQSTEQRQSRRSAAVASVAPVPSVSVARASTPPVGGTPQVTAEDVPATAAARAPEHRLGAVEVKPGPAARVVAPAIEESTAPEPNAPLPSTRRFESPSRTPEPPGEKLGESARDLFAAANQARSRGDATTALSLYRRLQSEYPASPEALAAKISIGMLQLQRGQPSSALAEFRAYRQAGARALRAEALWGEAEALRSLGLRADERATLDELLREYPNSAYASAARKRLEED